MRKISNEFYRGDPSIIIFGVKFEDIASKLEKNGHIFFKFQSISTLAIGSDRRHETVSVP